jgi:hypothetical protein
LLPYREASTCIGSRDGGWSMRTVGLNRAGKIEVSSSGSAIRTSCAGC